MQINVAVTDANNIVCEVVPPQTQVITIDRGVAGNGIVSIVPVTISTFQYLRITYTNGTVQDVGPLTSTAYTATAPITIVGNTISLATVPIASGGTDATNAADAIKNLLPSYTGNANKRLGLNSTATALEWILDGGGTVTSVAASGGTTGLTFTGSPITTSGTLTLGGTLAIANGGTGATSAANALTNLGAIGAITSTDGSVTITSTGTSRDLSVAVAAATNNVIAQVRNTTGSTLLKGTVVYISGATGQIPTVSKALATSDATSAQTLGMMTADLANNSNGNVTIIGLITNIDTSAYTDGQQLYLSGTTAGAVTSTKPYAPTHLVYVAVVEYAHPTQGKLFVKVQNGYELDEIHNVSAQTPSNGQTIVYNSSNSLWENNTVSLTIGVNGTLPIANGGTGQTTANAAFNALAPSQIGQSGKYLTTDGTNTSWATNPLGTVTSVAATVPSFLSISGSPITTSGTLAFGLSGTALPTTSGGTGLTSFTANGVVYASSTSALATGTGITFDGSQFYVNNTSATTGPTVASSAINGIGGNNFAANFTTLGEAYVINTASSKYQYSQAGTALSISATSNSVNSGALIDFNAYNASAGATGIYLGAFAGSSGNGPANFVLGRRTSATTWAESLRVDTSGNLGLGIIASVSDFKTLQIGYVGNGLLTTGQNDLILASNAYYSSGWRYGGSGKANYFELDTGSFKWYQANTSGTLGNAIAFTQAMTLDATGKLILNGTSSNGYLTIKNTNPSTSLISIQSYASPTEIGSIKFDQTTDLLSISTVNVAGGITFGTNGTERVRLTSGGNFGIGQTSPQTALGFANTASISWGTTNYPYINGDQGNNTISIGTQAKERFRIDSSGNAAIGNGTTSANTIASALYFGNFGTVVGSGISVGGALIAGISGSSNWYSGTSLGFYTNPGPDVTATGPVERARLTASGELLIGRSSSSGLGQLQSDGGADLASGGGSVYLARNSGGTVCITGTSSYAKATINAASLGNNAMLSLSTPDGTYNPRVIISHVTSTSSQYVNFNSSYSTGTGVANWVFASGNLGVGTASPSAIIHTASSGLGDTGGIKIQNTGSGGATFSIWPTASINGEGAGRLIISGPSGNVVTLTSGGLLGVGRTNPAYLIDGKVTSSATNISAFQISNDVDASIEVYLKTGATTICSGGSANLVFATGSVTERARFTASNGSMSIGTTSSGPSAGLRVSGGINPERGIVNTNIIAGFVSLNYSGTRYWLLHNMTGNPATAFNCMGDVHASSYTAWNLSNLWIRREYNTYNVYGGITGVIKSGTTVSIVDISYSSSRYVAIKFAGGDPGIEANLIGYLLDQMYTNGTDASFINGTSGVTENAVIASY